MGWKSERYERAKKTGEMVCTLPVDGVRTHVLLAMDVMMWAEEIGRCDNPADRRRLLKELSRATRSLRDHEASAHQRVRPVLRHPAVSP